jgi:membrane protease YdiL (CAAX protease family)
MSGGDRDPIESAVPALASALLAVIISMPIAAMLGNLLGISYETRSLIYVALIAWCCTGAIVLFIATLRAKRQPVSLRRVLVWTASIWVWPLLLWRKQRR